VGLVYPEAYGLNSLFLEKRFQRMFFLRLLFCDIMVRCSINIVSHRKAFQVLETVTFITLFFVAT